MRVFSVGDYVVAGGGSKSNRPAVMRKNMTRALDEFLSGSTSSTPSPSSSPAAAAAASSGSDVVYIGEDVEHGGYYLVTEGLKKKSPALFHTVSRCFKDFFIFQLFARVCVFSNPSLLLLLLLLPLSQCLQVPCSRV